jgi:lipocalin
MRVYNYYDGEWVTVTRMPREYDNGWFQVTTDGGGTYSLNGARVSTRVP